MNDDKKILFLERLTKLLNGTIKEKEQSTIESEKFCDALKWKLSRIMEEIYKLDYLSDDFELSSFVSSHIVAPIERMKEQMDKPWLKDKLTIGLLGHFNAGKTTALNLIFDEKFATERRENTALATYLVSGNNTDVLTVVDKGGKAQEISIDDSSLFDFTAGIRNFPFARIFEYVVKESNNSLLSQLTFIDTPGLNATNEHSEPSIRVIPNCDAIFWFIKLTGSVSEADLKFIKENINDKALFVIFSFVDAVENKEKSIEIALQRFKDFEIEVKGYFQLGRKKDIQENFKTTITRSIKDIANNYYVYNPYAHIYSVMCDMEELLVKFQTALTKEINNLDKKTDHISDTYSSSRSQFVTAWNNCTNRINNTIDTFNERCSNAMFCGGASSAIANNLNSIVSSLRDMGEAYDKIDASKLIEYGQQVTAMGQFQTKNERASELLKEIQETKKIFD